MVPAFMNKYFSCLGVLAVVATVACAPFRHRQSAPPQRAAAAPACTTDSTYQRLAFWVGDWDVTDSMGVHYATQRVQRVLDACAITADWASGGGYKGLSLFAFDVRAGQWRQMYAANQTPSPSGVELRTSDPSYDGPGIRFILLLDPADGKPARSRVTIMPSGDHGALQLFEDSNDGGKTWRTVFKAQHHLRPASER
jgi:hypothetical protein